MTNNITYVPGQIGAQAAQFDGASSFVQIPASVASDFSIALWVRTTATGGTGQWWNGKGLVDGEVSGAGADFGVTLLGSKAAFGVGNPDTTITSTTAINDGQWHQITATRNNTNGAIQLYVDGALQATATGPSGTRSAPPALRIGSLQTGAGFLAGAIDDVRLYNYALISSQVATLLGPASEWRLQWFGTGANTGNAADTADPDHDGMINLWERAFNLNPLVADTNGWPVGTIKSGFLTLTYRRNLAATDLHYQVQWSHDLIIWNTNNVVDSLISTTNLTEQRVGYVRTNTANPLFLRLTLQTGP